MGYPSSYSSSPRHYDHDSGPPVFLPPYQPGTPEEEEELALLQRLGQGQRAGDEPSPRVPQAEETPSHLPEDAEAEYHPPLVDDDAWPPAGNDPDEVLSQGAEKWQPHAWKASRGEEGGRETEDAPLSGSFHPALLAVQEPDDDGEEATDGLPPTFSRQQLSSDPGAVRQQAAFPSPAATPPGDAAAGARQQRLSAPRSLAGMVNRGEFRPVSTPVRHPPKDAPQGGRTLKALPPLGQQPPPSKDREAPTPPAPPPRQPRPATQTPAAAAAQKGQVTPYDVPASETDIKVVNGIYDSSPTARLVYQEALKLGYRTQFLRPQSVRKLNGDSKALATVVGDTIYVDTMDPKALEHGHGTAVFHEAFHLIQQQYIRDKSKLSPEARKLIENVRYREDYKVGISPSDLEARRVQNIILQETGRKHGVTYPQLKEYDGHFLPPGTETGRGGEHWAPKDQDVPRGTPPIPMTPRQPEFQPLP